MTLRNYLRSHKTTKHDKTENTPGNRSKAEI